MCSHICCFLCLEQACSISRRHSVNKKGRTGKETFSLGPLHEAHGPRAEMVMAGWPWLAPGELQLPPPQALTGLLPSGKLKSLKNFLTKDSALPGNSERVTNKLMSRLIGTVGVVHKSGQIITKMERFFFFPVRYCNVLDGYLQEWGLYVFSYR